MSTYYRSPQQNSSKQNSTFLFLCFKFYLFIFFTILYWCCHTLTWICHGCTCVAHPEPPSSLLPHLISLDHPSAPALSTLYHASNLDWWFISHMIIYMKRSCIMTKWALSQGYKDSSVVFKLINVIHHICKLKDKSHMIISTYADEPLNKFNTSSN